MRRSNGTSQFLGLVKAAYRLAVRSPRQARTELAEMFQTAQWAQGSEAATSLAQMAARGAKGDPALATIVRERQDLVAEWQKRDGARTAAVSQPPDKRDKAAEAANSARMSEIDARITEIDKRLAKDFPDYAALASPKPLERRAGAIADFRLTKRWSCFSTRPSGSRRRRRPSSGSSPRPTCAG